MTKKRAFAIAYCVLFVIPLILLVIFNSFKMPDLYYSFENDLENTLSENTAALSYGDLAFTDGAAKGRGLNLNDGFLSIDNSDKFLLSDQFTFSCWIKFNSLDSKNPMLLSRDALQGAYAKEPLSIFFSDSFESLSTSLTFKMKGNKTATHTFSSGNIFIPARLEHSWHHIAVVFNKNYLCYYLNGELVSTLSLPSSLTDYKSILNQHTLFSVGKGKNGNINASVDEIYFYDTALTSERIYSLYKDAKPQLGREIVLDVNQNTVWVSSKRYTAATKTIYDDETDEFMVPAKIVIDNMGGSIEWVGQDGFGRADISVGKNTSSIWVYDTHAIINGNYYKLNCFPTTIDDVLVIPASFLSHAFGAGVSYNQALMQLTITY